MKLPSDPLAETALSIVTRLQASGFSAFWVGGCVRDFLLGRVPGDYDVATAALPDQIEKIFSRTIPVGRKFGVMLVVEEGHEFQVATFRAEADYRDGRHPEQVIFGDAVADAQRRDFTINGLFFDPVKQELHDWVHGEPDMRARLIRTIGSAEERFSEDYLRMLRAVRLATQLGFEIEDATMTALRNGAARIKSISAERIRDELIKLFSPPSASHGLELLRQSGLLEHVLPEVFATIACEQSPDFHPEGSVFNHLRLMLEQLPAPSDPSLPWAVLMHDIAKPVTASRDPNGASIHFYGHERIGADMAVEILERLKFPRKQIDDISQVVRCHMQFKDVFKMRKSTVRQLLMRPTFPLELQLHRLDCLGSHRKLDVYDFLVQKAEELSRQPEIRPPLLSGHDLLALGFTAGPEIGTVLSEIRERQLEDELKTAEEALAWARQRLASRS